MSLSTIGDKRCCSRQGVSDATGTGVYSDDLVATGAAQCRAGETSAPTDTATPTPQTTTLTLWLRVENNKFVRGKKRGQEDIERYCLSASQMKKLREGQYELTFTYRDDADLDQQVYGLLDEIKSQADLRNWFTKGDMRLPGMQRHW